MVVSMLASSAHLPSCDDRLNVTGQELPYRALERVASCGPAAKTRLSFLSPSSRPVAAVAIYILSRLSGNSYRRSSLTLDIAPGMVESPYKVDGEVVAALRDAIRDCSDRGLAYASKW